MVLTTILKRSFLNPTPMMRVLDLSKLLEHKVIAKSSTSPMSLFDPPKAVNHKTALEVMKAVVDTMKVTVGVIKAPSFSVVL